MCKSATIKALISGAVTELQLQYAVGDVIESRDRAAEWFAYVTDPTAPRGSRVFQVFVEEDIMTSHESIKEQINSQLRRRLRH